MDESTYVAWVGFASSINASATARSTDADEGGAYGAPRQAGGRSGPRKMRTLAGPTLFVVALVLAFPLVSGGCSGCPDEQRREEVELPPKKQACTTTAYPDCVFDPPLPDDPNGDGFYPGVGESAERRLARWLPMSCEFVCSHLSAGMPESCEPATKGADGTYRVVCNVTYDTCHDTRL